VFIPLGALLVLSHIETRDERRDAEVSNLETISRIIAATVDGLTRDLETLTLAITLTYEEAGITPQSFQSPALQQSSQEYLRHLVDNYGILRTIFITDANGTVLSSSSGEGIGTNLTSRDYVKALQNGAKSVWSGGLSGLETGQTVLAHGRAVSGPDGRPALFVIAAFYPDRLASRLPAGLPDSGEVVVLDGRGTVLYASRPSPPPRPDGLSDWGPFLSARAGNTAVLRSETSPLAPGERYGALVPTELNGWVVSFTVPKSQIDGPLQDRFYRDLTVTALLLAGGFAAMFVIGHRLSRPLASLAGSAAAIARGERPVIPIDAADADVRELEVAMRTMSEAVAQREQEQREQAQLLASLQEAGARIASDLDFNRTVNAIADIGARLTGATNAAFFYQRERGGPYQLFTSSGVIRSLTPTEVSYLTAGFKSDRPALRLSDVTRAQFHAQVSPLFQGSGAQPPRSLLAVPIMTAERHIAGGLIFGHEAVNAFTERHEKLALGIASWANIALDNARLYAEAQAAQEELRAANRAKDDFLGIVSHELRTPITTIYGGARLLNARRKQLDEEGTQELISDIEQESERLYRLIQNLLILARTETKHAIEKEPVSVPQLAQKLVTAFTRRRPTRKIVVNVQPDAEVAFAEATYLEQILSNLINNADKYSPPDEPIEIDVRLEEGEQVFRVLDRGPGVPESEVERIFESFYRSSATKERVHGTGVGLAVCRRLVAAQGGRIWARLREGGGLEVGFALPFLTGVEAQV